jgi:hypothetical protein
MLRTFVSPVMRWSWTGLPTWPLLCLFLLGCGQSRRPISPPAPIEWAGRVEVETEWVLPVSVRDSLGPDQIQALVSRGFRLTDSSVVFPPVPAAGYYVELDHAREMIDSTGGFRVSASPQIHQGQIFRGLEDSVPLASFTLSDLAAGPIAIRQRLHGLGPMEIGPAVHSTLRSSLSGCPTRLECESGVLANDRACCRDYNGPSNLQSGVIDHLPIDRSDPTASLACLAQAGLDFVGSECWAWTVAGVCDGNEVAWGGSRSCWDNHKYRNCQTLDPTAFVVSTSTLTVAAGTGIDIQLRNNTPANETDILLSGQAGGSVSQVTAGQLRSVSPNRYLVHHYDDAIQRHYSDLAVHYVAPATPPANDAQEVLTFKAFGLTRSVTITVPPSCVIQYRMSATIDGFAWSTRLETEAVETSPDAIVISGGSASALRIVLVALRASAAEPYRLAGATLYEPTRTFQYYEDQGQGGVGSGQMRITQLSRSCGKIAGTFSFVAKDDQGEWTTVQAGQFDTSFRSLVGSPTRLAAAAARAHSGQ